jgi:hypothetical protein
MTSRTAGAAGLGEVPIRRERGAAQGDVRMRRYLLDPFPAPSRQEDCSLQQVHRIRSDIDFDLFKVIEQSRLIAREEMQ